jgi:predicted DNA-binding transcriptional regulator YafY
MNVRRITRLLKLLQMLHSGAAQNIVGLAKACGVSRRTAFRDIEALRAAGMPIVFDSDLDRYSISNSYYLPPLNLTPQEALSLIALAEELGQSDRMPFYEPARSAALKLEKSLSPSLRRRVRAFRSAIHIHPSPVQNLGDKRAIFQQLVDARTTQHVVRIEYSSNSSQRPTITKLRPYKLRFCRHSWYVIGRSSVHRSVKAFNLTRIRTLEVLEESFSLPRGFSIKRYLKNAWLLSPAPGPDEDIVVRFSPMVAYNVAEMRWHKTQQLEFQKDGSLVFRAQVSGLNEIIWWILAYGDQAEVLWPDRLRQLVAQRAKNMVAVYDGGKREVSQKRDSRIIG